MLTFQPEADDRHVIAALYEQHRAALARLVPSAAISHIGSTAIPGALTKGDLDLLVQVSAAEFGEADRLLASHYARNLGSDRNEVFASFKDEAGVRPVGIQLVVRGGAYDHFIRFRDALRGDAELLRRYNDLKRCFAGKEMDDYREAKSGFISRVLDDGQGRRAAPPGS